MMPGVSRYKKLKEEWEHARAKRARARVSIASVPADMIDMVGMSGLDRGLDRPKHLRGADLVQELARLALEWGDRRFAEAVRALFELGIVDKQSHIFTRKRGSHLHRIDKLHEAAEVAAMVRVLRERSPGLSEREACTKVAVELGWGAKRNTRFETAIEQVRNLSRKPRMGRREGNRWGKRGSG
jgi:hypothetical protein